jgi:hypothetical protein
MSKLYNVGAVMWNVVEDPLQVLFGIFERWWHLEKKTCELRTKAGDNEILEFLDRLRVR